MSVQVLRPTTINLYFSFLSIENPKKSGVATSNPVHLSPNEENTKYSEFFHLSIMSIFKTEANPKYLGLDTNNSPSFANNIGNTL